MTDSDARRAPVAVAAGHRSTAEAGAEILRAGGSAVDAAVAMMLVSCAAETIFTGLSGGGFATVYDAATRSVRCVDFFVAVPGLGGHQAGPGTEIEVIFVGDQRMPYDIGPATVAVPGIPAGAHHLWRRWGRLPWRDVVAPGLRASYGTPFPQTHAVLLPKVAQAMCVADGNQVYRRADGTLLQAGDPLRHPDHHRAFELLTEDPGAFYSGAYADAMLTALHDGGALSQADLSAYAVIESEPRSVVVGEHTVHARGDDLDDVLGTLADVGALAGDPLTDHAAAQAMIAALRAPDRRAETTNLVAVDAQGDGCVLTTSLGLGSGVWVPGYGVHLNSMMGEGELLRDQIDAGGRMGSMMSPLAALDTDRGLVALAGAAGGSRIRPALIQVLLRMLSGVAPQDAIDAPRLTALTELVRLEPGFSPAMVEALCAAGETVAVAEHRDPYFGGVSGWSRHGAGADPRRSGYVIEL